MSVPVAAYCHYNFAKLQQHHADSFFIKLSKGTDTEKGHPVQELRVRLANIQRQTRAGRIETIALTIKAWNAFREQKPVRTLYWDKGEEFPMAA
jgi:hypothetical protein